MPSTDGLSTDGPSTSATEAASSGNGEEVSPSSPSSSPSPSLSAASVRLPLLRALQKSQNDKVPIDAVVFAALQKLRAKRTIEGFLRKVALQHHQRQPEQDDATFGSSRPRKRRRKQLTSAAIKKKRIEKDSSGLFMSSMRIRDDALIRNVSSVVIAERRIAIQSLLKYASILHDEEDSQEDDKNEVTNDYRLCQVRDSIVLSAEYALEWTAVWKQLLLKNATIATSRGHFQALTHFLWKTSLVTGTLNRHGTDVAVQAVAAVADLLQYMVLYALKPVDKQMVAWRNEHWLWNLPKASLDGHTLSPFACLLGTYFRCLDLDSHSKWGQGAIASVREILLRMVSRRTPVRVISRSAKTASSSTIDLQTRRQRLTSRIGTFRASQSDEDDPLSSALSSYARVRRLKRRLEATGETTASEHDTNPETNGESENEDEDEDRFEMQRGNCDDDYDEEIESVDEAAEDDDDDDDDDDDNDDDEDDEEEEDENDAAEVGADKDVGNTKQSVKINIDDIGDDDDTVMHEVGDTIIDLDEDDAVEMEIEDMAAVAENILDEAAAAATTSESPKDITADIAVKSLRPDPEERRRIFIQASMQLLSQQYPHVHHHQGRSIRHSHFTMGSELLLIEGLNRIIRPPKKPVNTKIIMRRAPTQEEFFRGNLSSNPIPLSSLSASSGSESSQEQHEPTVADLRLHIARDLQMEESAELIEILVANKILDVKLKLRVVHQVVWRNYLIENNNSDGSGGTSILSGSGLSMIFSSSLTERIASGRNITEDTPLSALPAMIATYRLAGVDGEATEDTVTSLVDPEAPEASTPEEREALLEKEYGLTRLVTSGRGIFVLLRSIQHSVSDQLRRIRRDDVGGGANLARDHFNKRPPCPGLILLRHCSQIPSNRKQLLAARAPTILLTLLLDVLTVVGDAYSPGTSIKTKRESNSTSDILQDLIEVLTSDISSNTDDSSASIDEEYESDAAQDAASMPLLLESIERISLSDPLREVIAKLLPFLTYGQRDLSRTLANHFDRNIAIESLAACENDQVGVSGESVLVKTLVRTAVNLPPNHVCNSFRVELISCGFVERLAQFVCKDLPKQPPPWTPALWSKYEKASLQKKKGCPQKELEVSWRNFYGRRGVRTALKILTGLCRRHQRTQSRISKVSNFVRACHWVEATSDHTLSFDTHGLGLLAETLLDEMMVDNIEVSDLVRKTRTKTRERKKELANERRKEALMKMSSFGVLAGDSSPCSRDSPASNDVQGTAASILAPVLSLFRDSKPSKAEAPESDTPSIAATKDSVCEKAKAPTWLAEMEAMEDDVGLTCAVCQEGRTLQPTEPLGLYAYVKKVAIPIEHCGSRAAIEGLLLLKNLPPMLPDCLAGDSLVEEWYLIGKTTSEMLPDPDTSSSKSGNRRTSMFTTTVSAANAIHFSCHRKARQADRNHPKAPKSEWEGAVLRNNRVSCNVIFPLVSSRSSKVSLVAVDAALSEHQSAISNLLGTAPKSMLWTVLHDVRILLLRIAYGEALNIDCGGGSLFSNCQLIFYQLLMADMFEKDAQISQPSQSQHARALPVGFLTTCALVSAGAVEGSESTIVRGIADAALMASINGIVFHCAGSGEASDSINQPLPKDKRLWQIAKEYYLRGLLICGGRRHALGLDGSGCHGSGSRVRSSSFADWDILMNEEETEARVGRPSGDSVSRSRGANSASLRSIRSRTTPKPLIEEFQKPLRPMITLYAIFDQLSQDFSADMDDQAVEEAANRLTSIIEDCRKARNIHELLQLAKVTFDSDELVALLQKGMMAA